jgi:4-amino-4-deoxy-L-arabinose transferase-like glycosyltransferase
VTEGREDRSSPYKLTSGQPACPLEPTHPSASPLPSRPDTPAPGQGARWPWWLALAGLWLLVTAADRLWLGADQQLPAWDQADYLNSAVDHGRALGLLRGGGWTSWPGLLDLSPKIPPLASLVNGSVMALAGQTPDAASWALALWNALLLAVVALWGRQLGGPGFGLLAATLTAGAPALAELRVDYTLDLPLAATATLALWLLGRWQAPTPSGGRWHQAFAAALAVAAAILVKQSALLVVALPSLWAAAQGLRRRGRRLQVLLALAVVLALLLPWLHHNWISTLGGTNRAVFESGAAEGDPGAFSLASWLWYPRRLVPLLGPVILGVGLAGGVLILARWSPARSRWPWRTLPAGWGWLIGCCLAGWLATSLSPNKDARYITPVLPLLLLLLAGGWWRLGQALRQHRGDGAARLALAAGLLGATLTTGAQRVAAIQPRSGFPVPEAMAALRRRVGDRPVTVLLMASRPDLNEHTATVYGRLAGGRLVARQVGRKPGQKEAVLASADWLLLATGDQGSKRRSARELSQAVRADGRFERVEIWRGLASGDLELWQRRAAAPPARRFDADFQRLAPRMAQGPGGLAPLFASLGLEHQLDGALLYQGRVESWARQRLTGDAGDRSALWTLALLQTLRNRPEAAQQIFGRLQSLEPTNPWPASYRAVVLLADWRPWQARSVLRQLPTTIRRDPVIRGLSDLSGLLSGDLSRLRTLPRSLPAAVDTVKREVSPNP